MKKIIALGITAAFLSGISASAITVTVSALSGYSTGAPTSGGEYNVTPVSGSGYASSVLVNGGFETFCFDRNANISVPGTYNATINQTGVDASGNQLVAGVAWLYQQFAFGTLSGYNYASTTGGNASIRAQDAQDLQQSIWNLEGTYGPAAGTYADPLGFVALAVSHFGGGALGLAAALAATTGNAYDVGILNLNNISTGAAVQPMLTLLPDGGSALLLLGMSLSGLALVSRKIKILA